MPVMAAMLEIPLKTSGGLLALASVMMPELPASTRRGLSRSTD